MSYTYKTSGTCSSKIELELDGDVPFRNAARLTFSRLWQDEGPIRTNEQTGNQAAPRQQMVPGWQTVTLQSREGEYREAYALYLTAGEHRIGLTLYSIDKVLNGDLDPLLDPIIAADQAAKLAELNQEVI